MTLLGLLILSLIFVGNLLLMILPTHLWMRYVYHHKIDNLYLRCGPVLIVLAIYLYYFFCFQMLAYIHGIILVYAMLSIIFISFYLWVKESWYVENEMKLNRLYGWQFTGATVVTIIVVFGIFITWMPFSIGDKAFFISEETTIQWEDDLVMANDMSVMTYLKSHYEDVGEATVQTKYLLWRKYYYTEFRIQEITYRLYFFPNGQMQEVLKVKSV